MPSAISATESVTRTFFWQSAGCHVGIADGFYFFHLKALGQLIKD